MENTIRTLVPGDAGWIISNHGSVYANEFGFDATFEIEIARKMVYLFDKGDALTRFWIKVVNGHRAGSVAVSKAEENVAFVNFLLVLTAYRGAGIARELMEFAVDHSFRHGCERVRLETYSCLESARRLYAGMGFRKQRGAKKLSKHGQSFDQEFWELGPSKAV